MIDEIELDAISELLELCSKECQFVLLCLEDYEQYRISRSTIFSRYSETLLWGNRIKKSGDVSFRLKSSPINDRSKWYDPMPIKQAARMLKLKAFW